MAWLNTNTNAWGAPAPAANPFATPAPAMGGNNLMGNMGSPFGNMGGNNMGGNNLFGASPAPSNPFGAATTANPFGAPAPAPTTNPFGGGAMGASNNMFGGFGAPAPAPANPFGATTGNAFGNAFQTTQPAATNSLFSTPLAAPAPAPTNNLFGGGGGGNFFNSPAPAVGNNFLNPLGGGGGGAAKPRDIIKDKHGMKSKRWLLLSEDGNKCTMRDTIYGSAWLNDNNLVLGDAAGTLTCFQVGSTFNRAVEIQNDAPIVHLDCSGRMQAGVFVTDSNGAVKQWDLRTKNSKTHSVTGHCVSIDATTGNVAVGSWQQHIGLLDVRTNAAKKIQLQGRCHCIHINNNIIYAGVNKDPQNCAVVLYDCRNTSTPYHFEKLDPKCVKVRTVLRSGNNYGYVYGTEFGYIGFNAGHKQQSRICDLQQTFNQSSNSFMQATPTTRPANLMVNRVAYIPSLRVMYFGLSNGRIVHNSNSKIVKSLFASSAAISSLAANKYYLAVCCSYNYFDKGEQVRNGTKYPYQDVYIRKMKK